MKLFSLLLFMFLSACLSSSGNPAIQNEEVVAQIRVNETTMEEVEFYLGVPTSRNVTTVDGVKTELWFYTYAEFHTNPLLYVPIVGLFTLPSGISVQTQGVSVGFDRDGIVRSMTRDTALTGEHGIQHSLETEVSTQ